LGWKVDVISISWGYTEEVVEIKAAIRNAFHRGVIIFAAGGNSGGTTRNPILFPASLRQVICISSTDAFNKPSKFNPPATPDRTLSILGEAVTAAWPIARGEGETSVQSGSSIATPIAVGVAALVLEYVKQPAKKAETVTDHKRLNHSDQMRKVIYSMTNVNDGFHCITPAKLFDEKTDQRHVRICSTISGILDSL
jgi:subtilisin family serine protease